jgi:hypothetical protein
MSSRRTSGEPPGYFTIDSYAAGRLDLRIVVLARQPGLADFRGN